MPFLQLAGDVGKGLLLGIGGKNKIEVRPQRLDASVTWLRTASESEVRSTMEATPMITPKMVSSDRSLLALRPSSDTWIISCAFTLPLPCHGGIFFGALKRRIFFLPLFLPG